MQPEKTFPRPLIGKTGWPWNFTPKKISVDFDLPRVTIVTPSYNQAEYLEETIRSVLLQSYPNLEYFIMDGGSTDGSVEIIKKYEPWLTGWVSEKDNGQSAAINKGFSKATGEWLGWLNSDDCFAPDALLKLLKTAHDAQADFVYGACVQFGVNPEVQRFPKMKSPGPRAFDSTIITRADFIEQPAALWKREAYEQYGPLAEDLRYAFDWDFFIRCAQTSKGASCAQVVAAYRLHANNKSVELSARDEELISVSLKYLPTHLRKKFIRILPVIRLFKKTAIDPSRRRWLTRKIVKLIPLSVQNYWFRLFTDCRFLRLFGAPLELWAMYVYGGCVDENLVVFKVAATPAYTVADSLDLFL